VGRSSVRRARRTHTNAPSLLERFRALTGWKRIVAISALAAGALAVFGVAGGTAYAIQLENHDAFCASCHTEPETTYYQQSLNANTQNLAVFHAQKQVRCIDCHSGGGIFGRAQGLTQGAQDLLAYNSGHYHAPAVMLNPLGDGSCLNCHGSTISNRTFNNHFHVFLSEWQSVDPNAARCVDCHISHSTGDPNQQYLNLQTVQTICQDCHNVLRRGE
jgi:predicted CXXCH cytochrome family protein